MFRFTIHDVLWLTVVVALAFGWWREHRDNIKLRNRLLNAGMELTKDLGLEKMTEDRIEKALKLAEEKAAEHGDLAPPNSEKFQAAVYASELESAQLFLRKSFPFVESASKIVASEIGRLLHN